MVCEITASHSLVWQSFFHTGRHVIILGGYAFGWKAIAGLGILVIARIRIYFIDLSTRFPFCCSSLAYIRAQVIPKR